jgi:DNA polymerase III epsilon subunit-like protein
MKFYDGVKFMIKFISENGGLVMSHNLIGDLKFLVSTQSLVGGKRMVKNKLAEFPDTGMYDKKWEDIKKVCSMSLFCNRCPNMTDEYKKWARENNRDTGMNKLESLTQFVKRDREYREKHAAVQDTVDLFTVLKYAYKCDGPIMDGYSYLSKPNWVKVV